MATLELNTSTVFTKNYDALRDPKIRFVINQGGSRSSKTWSLCQMLIVYCLSNKNKIISIIRKSLPSLKGSVLRDFLLIMDQLGLYKESQYNRTELIYTFDTGSMIEFFSCDDSQKLRGRKRDIGWLNETNELSFEEFQQLNFRTTEKIICDYNPSFQMHWVYDLISRDNSILIHSTYKDNPFLQQELVNEIENLITLDDDYYRVYALGERGSGKTTIYSHWKYCDVLPEGERVIGVDFGFTHPTAVVECRFMDNNVYVQELLYESKLTSQDLIDRLLQMNLGSTEIVCDSARPEMIEDMKRVRLNAHSAIKDVKDGIDSVKTSALFINKSSINLLKEISSYRWKTNGDRTIDEPVKIYDDAVDAMRYSIHWYKQKNKKSSGVYHIL